ncbi:MAG: DUF2975 domain-containing protein [Rhodobacter sp.]|nr:DUF2975 domain-containing protein [Rhodobacter sp.]
MNASQFEKRVRIGSVAVMILVGLELLRYSYTAFARAYRFCFGDPARWNEHWMVDAGTQVGTGLRLGYFSFWSAVILASVAVFIAALFLLNALRRGEIFTEITAHRVQWVGGLLVFAMAFDTVFMMFDAFLISFGNAAGPRPIAYVYDPSDLKSATMGAILFLFGRVMVQAIEIDREYQEYV